MSKSFSLMLAFRTAVMRAISSEVVKGETMLARDSVWLTLRPKQV